MSPLAPIERLKLAVTINLLVDLLTVSIPFQMLSLGSRWKHQINPEVLGNVSAGAPGWKCDSGGSTLTTIHNNDNTKSKRNNKTNCTISQTSTGTLCTLAANSLRNQRSAPTLTTLLTANNNNRNNNPTTNNKTAKYTTNNTKDDTNNNASNNIKTCNTSNRHSTLQPKKTQHEQHSGEEDRK